MNIQDLYPELNPKEVYENFLHDLRKSSKGEITSLRFIHNNLPQKRDLPEGTKIQVIVIGGTICRSAIIEKTIHGMRVLEIRNVPKVSFPTKEEYLSFSTDVISPDISEVVINSADTIQPVYENGKMDGILIALSKENRMEGLLHEKIGEETENYLKEKLNRKIHVNVANDTICLLLSGLTHNTWDTVAGGIIGTGINLAFFLNEHTAINLEAGDYSNFTQSKPGEEIDKNSDVVGGYRFEKETSGGYLYQHFNHFIKKYKISYPKIIDSAALSQLASQPVSDISSIAQQVLNHSATLAACQMAGLLTFLDKDMTFIMQGSVFWKGYRYKEKVEEVMGELEPNCKATFIDIPDADILGAAEVIF